jgi:hypothetical protein
MTGRSGNTTMREPRKLSDYCSAVEAAEGLEQLAATIRANAEIRPLVKWYLNLSFWNPDWTDRFKASEDHRMTGASFSNKKSGDD